MTTPKAAPATKKTPLLEPTTQTSRYADCRKKALLIGGGAVILVGIIATLAAWGNQANNMCTAIHTSRLDSLKCHGDYKGLTSPDCYFTQFGCDTKDQTIFVNAGEHVTIGYTHGGHGNCLSANSSCDNWQVVPDDGLTCVTTITGCWNPSGVATVTTKYVVDGVTDQAEAAASNNTNQATALSDISFLRGNSDTIRAANTDLDSRDFSGSAMTA